MERSIKDSSIEIRFVAYSIYNSIYIYSIVFKYFICVFNRNKFCMDNNFLNGLYFSYFGDRFENFLLFAKWTNFKISYLNLFYKTFLKIKACFLNFQFNMKISSFIYYIYFCYCLYCLYLYVLHFHFKSLIYFT